MDIWSTLVERDFHQAAKFIEGRILGPFPSLSIHVRQTVDLDWRFFAMVLWSTPSFCHILTLLARDQGHVHARGPPVAKACFRLTLVLFEWIHNFTRSYNQSIDIFYGDSSQDAKTPLWSHEYYESSVFETTIREM